MAPAKKVPAKRAKATPPVRKPPAAAVGSKSTPRSDQVTPSASEARLACPRCGTTKFAREERIRAEGARTVRFTVLVCERGHTFAKPRVA